MRSRLMLILLLLALIFAPAGAQDAFPLPLPPADDASGDVTPITTDSPFLLGAAQAQTRSGGVSLIANGGFENSHNDRNPGRPAIWERKNTFPSDIRTCDEPAPEGLCAFHFNLDPSVIVINPKRNLKQVYEADSFGEPGGVLAFSALVKSENSAISPRIRVVVTYRNGTKDKIVFNPGTDTGGYVTIADEIVLQRRARKVVVNIIARSTGSFHIDDVNLTLYPPGPVAVDDAYETLRDSVVQTVAPGVLGNDTLNGSVISAYDNPTAQGGQIDLEPDGAFTYTPPVGYIGVDTFTYTLDNGNATSTATVTVTVFPQPPAAVDDAYSMNTGTVLEITDPLDGVLANDTLEGGATISTYTTTGTAGGTVSLNADGTFTYTPASPTFDGVDTFTYTLENISGTSTATVTITVNPVPTARNDAYDATQGTVLNVDAANGILANDTLNGASIITPTTGAPVATSAGGSITITADGSFAYTPPAPPPFGVLTDTLSYTIENAFGDSTATITFTVYPPQPVAVNDDGYEVIQGNSLTNAASVLTNDTVNNATISAFDATGTEGGTVSVNANGTFDYTPPAVGVRLGTFTDTFTYTLTNASGSDTATVSITVKPPAPIAVDDSGYEVIQGNGLTSAASVLTNDTPYGATISGFDATSTEGGTVSVNANGTFDYTPPAVGVRLGTFTDTFTYTLTNDTASDTATVSITVKPPAPIAVDDDYDDAGQGATYNGASVLANDTPYGATITAFDATSAEGGTVSVNADGTFTYNPPSAAFLGEDTFTYTLTNDTASDTATVTITVNPTPTARNDAYDATQGTQLIVEAANGILANDTLNGAIITSPFVLDSFATGANGTLRIEPSGAFVYTPPTPPPFGVLTDSISYTITNAFGSSTATITFTVYPPQPVAVNDTGYIVVQGNSLTNAASVLANDTVNGATITAFDATSAEGGTVSVNANGTFDYTPPAVAVRLGTFTDTFTYTLTNASGSDTATVSITVKPPAPVAVDDSGYEVIQGNSLTSAASVLANDTPYGATISAFDATSTEGGTVSVNANGTFDYTPPTPAVRLGTFTDTFTYTLTNDTASDTATVSITVRPPAPVAVDDSGYDVDYLSDITVSAPGVLGNDTPYGATLALVSSTSAKGGTVAMNANGSFTYTAPDGLFENFNDTDTFQYILTNDTGTDTATVTINLRVPAPIAVDDGTYDVHGNLSVVIPVSGLLANDTLNFGTFSLAGGASAQGGTVTYNAVAGTVTYSPATGFKGEDTFEYTLTNVNAAVNATVTVDVDGMIWIIDNTAAAGGTGRPGSPFDSIAAFNAASALTKTNDKIYLMTGTGTYTGAGFVLKDGMTVYGQPLSINTLLGTLPTGTITTDLPTTNPIRPVITTTASHAISFADNTEVRAVNVGNTPDHVALYLNDADNVTVPAMVINGTGGIIWALDSSGMNITLDAAISTGSVTRVYDFDNVSGTVSITTGVIEDMSDIAINLENSSGFNFAYLGAVRKFSAGLVININNLTGTNSILLPNTLARDLSGGVVIANTSANTTINVPVQLTLGIDSDNRVTGDGLVLNQVAGTVNINNLQAFVTGRALHVTNIAPVTTTLNITNGHNLMSDAGGRLVSLTRVNADINLGNLTVNAAANEAVYLNNVSGTFNVNSAIVVTGYPANAIAILDSSANIRLGVNASDVPTTVNLTGRTTGTGINIVNATGIIKFGNVTINNTLNLTAPPVVINGATQQITFASAGLANARTSAFALTNVTGGFTVNGGNNPINTDANYITASNVTNLTIDGVTVTSAKRVIHGTVNGLIVRNSNLSNIGSVADDWVFSFGNTSNAQNLTGLVLFDNVSVDNVADDVLVVSNSAGTLNITVRNATWQNNITKGACGGNACGGNAVFLQTRGNGATINALVKDMTFTNITGANVFGNNTNGGTLNLRVLDNTFTPFGGTSPLSSTSPNAVLITQSGTGTNVVNADIIGNTTTQNFTGSIINVRPGGNTGTADVVIANNTLYGTAVGFNSPAITVLSDAEVLGHSVTTRALVQSNNIATGTGRISGTMIATNASDGASLDVTIRNNFGGTAPGGDSAIRAITNSSGTMCARIIDNSIVAGAFEGIYAGRAFGGGAYTIHGPATADVSATTAWLSSNNTISAVTSDPVTVTTTGGVLTTGTCSSAVFSSSGLVANPPLP